MLLSNKEQVGKNDKFVILGARSKRERKQGRWSPCEKEMFLRGLRQFGKGKWKQIQQLIPTRTTIQVKTHAQMILRRIADGEDIFAELRNDINTSLLSPSPKEPAANMRKFLFMTPEYKDLEAAKILVDLQIRK